MKLVLLAFFVVLFFCKIESLSVINGTGSTFAQSVYQNYIFAYSLKNPNTKITYTGTGSGTGRRSIIADSVLWAGSDIGLSASETAQAPNVQAYPMIAGGIVRKLLKTKQ